MPLVTRPDATEINPAARLLDQVRRDGPILSLPGGVVGIFDPVLAMKVDKANSENLKVAESLVDLLKIRKTSDPVAWREVRGLIAEQSAKLSAPEHMKALHERMRAHLGEHLDRNEDLTRLVWQTMSRTLIPLVIDDLDEKDSRVLAAEQDMRFRIQQAQRIPFWRRISDFMLLRASTRAITRKLKRRLRSGDSHEDFAQALLTLSDRIGVDRVTYLMTVQLIAISGVPGMMAACILYALHAYPEWRERMALEMDELATDELYSLPTRKLPCTMRFIKEAMRLWATPFVTRRVAAVDIQIDGVSLKKGETYELSSYILHHSEQYWDDPETFDPDRWLPSRRPASNGAYVPFGFGPRSCAGASVGNAQLILFCALVTRDFEFKVSPDHEPWMRLNDGFALPADLVGMIVPRSGSR